MAFLTAVIIHDVLLSLLSLEFCVDGFGLVSLCRPSLCALPSCNNDVIKSESLE